METQEQSNGMNHSMSQVKSRNKSSLSTGIHRLLLLISACYLATVSISNAYLITLDIGVENECFHERVPVGTKLGFTFEVIEGGFYDVDIKIKDPQDVILHQDERSSHGKFTIEANLDGPYQFCFSNTKSSHTPKVIIFDIDKSGGKTKPSQTVDDKDKEDSEATRILDMIGDLTIATINARHDVHYLSARDKVHRRVNEKTNKTIVWWSGLEFLLLLAVTLGQVWYLRRFFEIRRKA